MEKFEINERELYQLKRKRLKIKLTEIGDFVGIDASCISRYERYQANMSKDKRLAYKKYIDEMIEKRAENEY